MAAAGELPVLEICELRHVSRFELDRLLDDEVEAWERQLAWDFRPSAELVRRFVQMQSLTGFAIRHYGELVGYSYHVCDERKGLIGDFYVRPTAGTTAHEMALMEAVVSNLVRTPGIRRIESQLMMLQTPPEQILPFRQWLTRHDRFFMEISRDAVAALPPLEPTHRIQVQGWNDRMQEEAAHVISAAYRGHVDSEINDQYRNIPGARRFLTNIVRYPGCGKFTAAGSFVAVDEHTGRVCGICLSSMVAPTSGHITQLCVLPGVRGTHIGYELLRTSVSSLMAQGCETVSLTNVDAVRLYERIGFQVRTSFPALVWEDF
jgi:ribosomal protein S18 acetylase RimI-like enzyme